MYKDVQIKKLRPRIWSLVSKNIPYTNHFPVVLFSVNNNNNNDNNNKTHKLLLQRRKVNKKSKRTLKHANSILLESFEHFSQMSLKSILIISS